MRVPRVSAREASAAIITGEDGLRRCWWAESGNAELRRYHDEEWGVPVHDDRLLFEHICLEGFQAGLSWSTVLNKRPAFRRHFHDFDISRVARLGSRDIDRMMGDASLIRNRAKIEAAIGNAVITRDLVQARPGALDDLIWSFAPKPRARRLRIRTEVPAITSEAEALSTELRKRGFRFVGPTTMYALMQSAGMVDDHIAGCLRSTNGR
jgi:DNA-3-methyladenine glycosylase I